MRLWFRIYGNVINDPKVLRLSEGVRWRWVAIMCATSITDDEKLPPLADLALMLRLKPQQVAATLTELHAAHLLDKNDDGSFSPHNWDERQFKTDAKDPTAAKRARDYRDRKRFNRDASRRDDRDTSRYVTVHDKRPETKAEADAETEQNKNSHAVAIDDGWPSDFRERFWQKYPNKVGKPKALAKLEGVRKRGVAWRAVMDGLERYIRNKPPDRAWLNPETFINQERWADEPAPVSAGSGQPRALGFENLFSNTQELSHDNASRQPFDLELTADPTA